MRSSPSSKRSLQKNDRAPLESALETRLGELYRTFRRELPPTVQVRFHRYSRLAHNIRHRDGRIEVRLSDILLEAPREVLDALLAILLRKLYRRRPLEKDRECYLKYVNLPETRARTRSVRKKRSSPRMRSATGEVFDLEELFEQINQKYFDHKVEIDHLGWSLRKRKRILGHFDAAHSAIVIDRSLDNPLVPSYVVEYVLFHEMLHVQMGEEVRNGIRYVHHKRFKKVERQFPDYRRAQQFIRENLPGKNLE